MKAFDCLVRNIRMIFVLSLLVSGSLGQAMPGHANISNDANEMSTHTAMATMPMDHVTMNSTPDAQKVVCELHCLALVATLPVSPAVLTPVRRVQIAQAGRVLLPEPHDAGPDARPPKPSFL